MKKDAATAGADKKNRYFIMKARIYYNFNDAESVREFVVAFHFEMCIIDMGMKFSLGKPKLLIKADDFCDHISQKSLAFLHVKEEFLC